MDREDIYSVIAYIRTLPSIKNDVPKDEVKFPMSMIMKTIPTEKQFTQKPDKKDIIAYGDVYKRQLTGLLSIQADQHS